MNKQIIIASAVAAGAAVITYLIKKRSSNLKAEPLIPAIKRRHHRIDIFAKAKKGNQQSISHNGYH